MPSRSCLARRGGPECFSVYCSTTRERIVTSGETVSAPVILSDVTLLTGHIERVEMPAGQALSSPWWSDSETHCYQADGNGIERSWRILLVHRPGHALSRPRCGEQFPAYRKQIHCGLTEGLWSGFRWRACGPDRYRQVGVLSRLLLHYSFSVLAQEIIRFPGQAPAAGSRPKD